MTPQEAQKKLQQLIDFCVYKGGVFKTWEDSAAYQAALITLINLIPKQDVGNNNETE